MGRPKRKLHYYVSGEGHWPGENAGTVHWDAIYKRTLRQAVRLARNLDKKGFKEILLERRAKHWTEEFEWNTRNKEARWYYK